ncbi:MAG: heat shock protein HspQ [Phycisphaeraceae bacterium]
MNPHDKINVPDYFPVDVPRFAAGQLVRHKQYGYRGVVVDFDLSCRANEQWYQGNQSQPEREQPWYHVLVDGSEIATYAAESSLDVDEDSEAVTHALIRHFFDAYDGQRYVRNDEPWPGWM